MKHNKISVTIGSLAGVLALATVGAGIGANNKAHATSGTSYNSYSKPDAQRYTVNFRPLNNSGVRGSANIVLNGRELTVTVRASGLTPNQVHAQHIHGQSTMMGAAECPTIAQDTNKDKFISVTEGAPTYGPIKLNLTNPQTPFGPNNTVLNGVKLFTDFAGVPVATSFPKADSSGNVYFTNTYLFDTKNAAANAAFKTLNPLTDQEVVLHGAMAPVNVETAAGGGATIAYDGLLPVACARIMAVNHRSDDGQKHDNDKDRKHDNYRHESYNSDKQNGYDKDMHNNRRTSNYKKESYNSNSHRSNNITASYQANDSNGDNYPSSRSWDSSYSDSSKYSKWSDMDPMSWKAKGHDFNSWWGQMDKYMQQHDSSNWTMNGSKNSEWKPSGDNWQNTWSNWEPAMWQAHGQSYNNWSNQMHDYMSRNCNNWMQNWHKTDKDVVKSDNSYQDQGAYAKNDSNSNGRQDSDKKDNSDSHDNKKDDSDNSYNYKENRNYSSDNKLNNKDSNGEDKVSYSRSDDNDKSSYKEFNKQQAVASYNN